METEDEEKSDEATPPPPTKKVLERRIRMRIFYRLEPDVYNVHVMEKQ